MRLVISALTIAFALAPLSRSMAGEVSVERGLKVSIVGACHDCHTEGYRESEGKIDPEKALKGSKVGWRGPWGTTYAANLRRVAERLSEDGFLLLLSNFRADPPMPWYNVRAMEETDMRSLYRYIRSLGDPGESGPRLSWAGRRAEDPLCPIGAAGAAEGLRKGLGLRRRAGLRRAGPLCSEIERPLQDCRSAPRTIPDLKGPLGIEARLHLLRDRAKDAVDREILGRVDRRDACGLQPLGVGGRDDAADDHRHMPEARRAKRGDAPPRSARHASPTGSTSRRNGRPPWRARRFRPA